MDSRPMAGLTWFALAGSVACGDSPPDDCEQRSVEDCASDGRCSNVEAWVNDESAGCWRRAIAGCLPAQRDCSGATALTTAPDGTCWFFGDLCIPEPYVELDGQAQDGGLACNYDLFEEHLECSAGK